MEISIPAESIREFTAVLKCFKSFSENLHLHPTKSHFKLSAVSATRSTYAVSVFDEAYFESFRFNLKKSEPIEVAIKPIFKILSYHISHTSIESCFILIETGDDDGDDRYDGNQVGPSSVALQSIRSTRNRITIKLKLTSGISKLFSIPYSTQNKNLYPIDSRSQNSPNRWICLSNYLKHWFEHFSSSSSLNPSGANSNQTNAAASSSDGVEEICFCYQDDGKVCLRTMSLMDQGVDKSVIVPRNNSDIFYKGVRQLSTSLTVESNVFEEYQVELGLNPSPMIVTVSMKEVGSVIELGMVMGSNIDSGFSVGGRPVYFTLENQESKMKMDFVLASTNGEDLIQKRLESEKLHQSNQQRQQEKQKQVPEGQDTQDLSGTRQQSSANNRPDLSLNSENQAFKRFPNPRGVSDERASINQDRSQSALQRRAGESEPLFRAEVEPVNNDNNKTNLQEAEEDEFDRMTADRWNEVEAEAILQSQNRQKRQKRMSDQDEQVLENQALNQNDERLDEEPEQQQQQQEEKNEEVDDRLIPTQVVKNAPWKLFD